MYINRTSFTKKLVKTKQNNNQGALIKKTRQNTDAQNKAGLTNNKQKQKITFISYGLRLEEPTQKIAKRGRHNPKKN